MNKNKTIYLGPFFTDQAIKDRKLPSKAIAAFNRMHRIASAIQADGGDIKIISPGMAMRCGYSKKIISQQLNENINEITAVTLTAICIPFLGFFLEPLMILIYFIKLAITNQLPSQVLVYNFVPTYIPTLLFLKLIGTNLFCELEDISVPSFMDWKIKSETRALQQLIYWVSMNTVLLIVKGVVIPTIRFKKIIPKNKPYQLITGCFPANQIYKIESAESNIAKLKILFVGKYEFEHGYDVLLDCLKLITNQSQECKFDFYFCGIKTIPKNLSEYLDNGKFKIYFSGFPSTQEYLKLLDNADICLALQKSKGRHSSYKTPSKAYEFISKGKITIITNVGDLSTISDAGAAYMLADETGKGLLSAIEHLSTDYCQRNLIQTSAVQFANNYFAEKLVGHKLICFFNKFNPK